MAWYLDFLFDRVEGGIEIIGGVHKWVIPGNWKLAADNFVGDGYHFTTTHISAMKSGFSGDGPSTLLRPNVGMTVNAGNGHGFMLSTGPQYEGEQTQLLRDYVKDFFPEMESRIGAKANVCTPGVGASSLT